jgi:hypothetical protein
VGGRATHARPRRRLRRLPRHGRGLAPPRAARARGRALRGARPRIDQRHVRERSPRHASHAAGGRRDPDRGLRAHLRARPRAARRSRAGAGRAARARFRRRRAHPARRGAGPRAVRRVRRRGRRQRDVVRRASAGRPGAARGSGRRPGP